MEPFFVGITTKTREMNTLQITNHISQITSSRFIKRKIASTPVIRCNTLEINDASNHVNK